MDYFYNATTRKYVVVMGTIFDKIKTKKGNNAPVVVPLLVVNKDKTRVRTHSINSEEGHRVAQVLPLLSLELTGIQYDPDRQLNKNLKHCSGMNHPGVVSDSYQRVPYNFLFQVSAKTKTIDEMLQIIEQILSFFDPKFTVRVKDNETLGLVSEINIVLDAFDLMDTREGEWEQQRSLVSTFNFILQGYIYRKTEVATGIIHHIEVGFNDSHNFDGEDLGGFEIDEEGTINIIEYQT